MQTQASDEEISVGGPFTSGGGGNPRLPDSNIRGKDASKLLRAVAKKHNIVSTKSLVEAYNATTVVDERAVLLDWLLKYGETGEDCLKPKTVLEYSELAKVACVSERDAKVPRNLVYDICSLIRADEFLDENVGKALLSALTWVDATVYDDLAKLFVFAKSLLFSLSSEPRLNKHNFAKYEANFLALHHVFFLLQSIGRGYVLEKEKEKLRQAVAQKRVSMELSVLYYPVFFHFEFLQQAVERLEIEDVPSGLTKAKRYTASGLYVGIHVFHFLRKLAGGDIDPTSIEDAYRKGRAAIANAGVPDREWYDVLQILTAARILASKEKKKCEIFSLACDAALEGQRKTKREDEQKALRFGIVQEMRLLASDKDSRYDSRKKATTKLVELATNHAISENWIHDADVLTAILDALHATHITGEQNQEIAEALQKIQQSCDERGKKTLTIWLDSNTIEEKLQMQRQEQTDNDHEDHLFAKTGACVGYLHLSTIRSNIEELKKTYLHNNFATVPSLFESEVRRHVRNMEHHVVMYEEIIEEGDIERREGHYTEGEGDETEEESSAIHKRDDPKEHCERRRRVTTPISIEDLFKPRSLEAGVDKNEIRRVLLYGNPGSGKTCASKAIAHKWALGKMLQDFKAIYVVPIRRLNNAKARRVRGETLEEVIAQMCFKQKGSDDEFEKLKTQINDDLDISSTLLVFDGLDEADDDAREILSEAEKAECKLLILTRPYNLQEIHKRVDCQFECLGFNDQQLKNYFNKELQQDEASRLIHSLQQDLGMWETAHTPVTAQILCSLSKEHGTSIEDRCERANKFQIYNNMTNFVWKRFKERHEAGTADKTVVFGDLENIAFEALQNGQILIEESIVESQTTSTNTTAIFKESGFLLLVLEGEHYQFPHLTFQEYFAGRFIAKSLKKKGSDEEKQVLKFIQEGKYDQKHDLTMYFAVHAFARVQKEGALQEMLSIIDEQPVEVLGVQHFFLKLRVLEAILEETDEDDLEDLLNDEQATKLGEGARQLLEHVVDDVLIREIVIEEFQHLSSILEGFPQVLNATIEEGKKLLAHSKNLTWTEMAKITDLLKLARHSPRLGHEMIQFVLKLANQVDGWCNPSERMKRFESIATQIPRHADEVFPALAKWCGDRDPSVRQKAIETIGRVAAEATQHVGEYLPTLAKMCSDKNLRVCRAAKEAIGRVVRGAPQHVGDFQLILENWRDHERRLERRVAIVAIVNTVAEVPKHAGEVLPTLTSWFGDEDSGVRSAVIETIANILAAAPQHADEVLPSLANGCADENSGVRSKAIEAIGCVVKAAPQHAEKVLPMLANGCAEDDSGVRRAAIRAIGCVVAAAPQHADEVLLTLANKCAEDDSGVRSAAIEVIGSLVTAAPQHADEVLPTLANGCADENSGVRSAVIETIANILAAAPQHADEVLPSLANGCADENSGVRSKAIEAIGCVVKAAPQHAEKVLPMLANGCAEDDSGVRRAAIRAIGCVVAAAPQHADEVLLTLANGCADVSSNVRSAAIEAIGSLVAAAPHHADEVLSTLTKGCGDENWNVRSTAMETMGCIVVAAPQHASEVLLTLAKGFNDEGLYIRQMAKETFGRVVASVPHHAGEILPTLADWCVDVNSGVRSAAMETIGCVVKAAGHHEGVVLSTLTNGCVDDDPGVRSAAIEAIGSLVTAAPQHADEVLPTLAKGYNDKDLDVRSAAIEAIGSLVAAAPQHADEVLPTLTKGCGDENWNVRRAATTSIDRVVEAAPQHAGDVLPTLTRECDDVYSYVRQAAVQAICRVAAAAPQHAIDLQLTLAKACDNKYTDVRQAAMEAIGRILATAPEHASGLPLTLAMKCGDENWGVRNRARTALKNVNPEKAISQAISFLPIYISGFSLYFVQNPFTLDPAASETIRFVLHTTSSHKFGGWNEEDVDLYLDYLRQEFNDKFPGLLQSLEMEG